MVGLPAGTRNMFVFKEPPGAATSTKPPGSANIAGAVPVRRLARRIGSSVSGLSSRTSFDRIQSREVMPIGAYRRADAPLGRLWIADTGFAD